jgi:hypothetical protein
MTLLNTAAYFTKGYMVEYSAYTFPLSFAEGKNFYLSVKPS